MLGYSGTVESRQSFGKTNVVKELLRVLHVLEDEKDAAIKEN